MKFNLSLRSVVSHTGNQRIAAMEIDCNRHVRICNRQHCEELNNKLQKFLNK